MKDKSKIKKKKINFEEPVVDKADAEAIDVVETTATAVPDDEPDVEAATEDTAEIHMNESTEETKEKVKIDFPFSELIRAKIPKVFDVAETAATQWKHDEKFENLGVPHPVGEIALAKALEKAKDVEKKLEEKGVISAAKMGIAVAKFQAQDLIKKFKKNE